MLTSSPSQSARTFAARSLGNLGKRSAYAYLRKGLRDEKDQVVISCLRAIGRLRIAQSGGDLSAVFNAGNAEIRRVVLETVGEIDRLPTFRNLILAGLEDTDTAVRQRALKLFLALER
jgi:HEAT repeat protein